MSDFNTGDFQQMNDHFQSGATRGYTFRKKQLKTLLQAIHTYEAEITNALHKDLHKSATESFYSEYGLVQTEIRHAINNLGDWMAPQHVRSPWVIFPSESKIVRDPLGVCLIIAPWNYPFMLLMAPLVGAIAGGNCAVLKPSELTPHTSAVVSKMIRENFAENYIRVVEGDGSIIVPRMMRDNRFAHVFFTGSTTVGKAIARLAAEQLVPVTLELGGKSPCIIDADANITVAAKRITWGKFTNAGQTCVAPDYLLVHEQKKEALVQEIRENIRKFYGSDPQLSPDYGRIINNKRFDTLVEYLQQGNMIEGGKADKADRYIAPTLMDDVRMDVALMQEEIFGPILPIITFTSEAEVMEVLQHNPNPLSFYYFGNNSKKQQWYMNSIAFGGGCINNTLVHLGNIDLPFGGVGHSGVGAYHGRHSFDTFTRMKSIVKTGNWLDPSIKYPPYKGKLKWFKRVFRMG